MPVVHYHTRKGISVFGKCIRIQRKRKTRTPCQSDTITENPTYEQDRGGTSVAPGH